MARWLVVFSLPLALSLGLGTARADDAKKSAAGVETFFKKLDANNDGKLTKEEFLRLAERFKDRSKARQRLATVYDRIDTGRVGITREQFKLYLENNPKKEARP